MANKFAPSDFAILKSRVFDIASMMTNDVDKEGKSLGWKKVILIISHHFTAMGSILASHLNCHLIIASREIAAAPFIGMRSLAQPGALYEIDHSGFPQEA